MLVDAGISMDFESGGHSPEALVDREIKREPHARVKKLKDIFMQTLSSANNEFPYWYTREYMAHDSEVPVVRRAMALKTAFSHLTPVIYPGELLTMRKASFFRGSFPMPWLSEGYYMAKEDELYQDALKRGSASADEHSTFGTGGGNVTKSFGKVVSIASKFGMRQEEVPGLLKVARKWVGKSVDDLGHKYEQMVPDYEVKEALMRNIVCMFDSGYTLPQGREVINYYYMLELGIDGIINTAKEMKAKVAGKADGDGLVGTNRLYNYEAIILAMEGVKAWICNYAKEARRLESIEKGRRPEARVRPDRRAAGVAVRQQGPRLPGRHPDDPHHPPGRGQRGRHLRHVPRTHRPGAVPVLRAGTSRAARSPRTRSWSCWSSTAWRSPPSTASPRPASSAACCPATPSTP